jgi:hypothetical protein
MSPSRKQFSESFKRQAVARMTGDPVQITALANELGVARTLLYTWRKRYAPPPVSPLPEGEGPGVRAAQVIPPHGWGGTEGGVGAGAGAKPPPPIDHERLRQTLLATAFALAHAIAETTESAPLNQISAALGLVIDRLLKLEALYARSSASSAEEVISIEYRDPDGTRHASPPWARGDSAFEDPVSRGRVRSPFWENRDGQADDPGDGPARG